MQDREAKRAAEQMLKERASASSEGKAGLISAGGRACARAPHCAHVHVRHCALVHTDVFCDALLVLLSQDYRNPGWRLSLTGAC